MKVMSRIVTPRRSTPERGMFARRTPAYIDARAPIRAALTSARGSSMNTLSKLAVAWVLLSGTAFAQSAKYSLQVADFTLLDTPVVVTSPAQLTATEDYGWTTLLKAPLKTSSQKDLVMGVSLEAGLYTDTTVVSQKLLRDQSVSTATVQVRVLVDPVYVGGALVDFKQAAPGDVTFAKREQGLVAKFGGYMECVDALTVDTNGDGIADAGDGVIQYAECTISDESLQLWLETLDAQAFFFAFDDVGTGQHTVEVQARILVSGTSEAGGTATRAWIGKGALTVEEVRLVKGQDITSNGTTIQF